jgi:hypothetical protein
MAKHATKYSKNKQKTSKAHFFNVKKVYKLEKVNNPKANI